MKKLLFILILLTELIYGQGTTVTPYDTTGWSAPWGYTQYYRFYIFTLLTNPGGRGNLNTRKIDSLFNKLIVFTDTTQLSINNDTLKISDYATGHGVFDTTAQTDTVTVTGIDSSDVVVVTVREQAPGANDLLGVKVIAGKFIVMRPSSGTSGLKYNWYWIRKY